MKRSKKMIEQLTGDCGYRPEQYIQTAIELGGVRAAKQLVAGPLSDDSVQVWAWGRPDLMIEAIVLNDDWKGRWCMNRSWPATNPTHRSITCQERTTMA